MYEGARQKARLDQMLAEPTDQNSMLRARDRDALVLEGGMGRIEHAILRAVYGAIQIACREQYSC